MYHSPINLIKQFRCCYINYTLKNPNEGSHPVSQSEDYLSKAQKISVVQAHLKLHEAWQNCPTKEQTLARHINTPF